MGKLHDNVIDEWISLSWPCRKYEKGAEYMSRVGSKYSCTLGTQALAQLNCGKRGLPRTARECPRTFATLTRFQTSQEVLFGEPRSWCNAKFNISHERHDARLKERLELWIHRFRSKLLRAICLAVKVQKPWSAICPADVVSVSSAFPTFMTLRNWYGNSHPLFHPPIQWRLWFLRDSWSILTYRTKPVKMWWRGDLPRQSLSSQEWTFLRIRDRR